ncbi:MAG: ABC transporter ATP-binding protein [Selenomonadaceae bacterium]|nr:ABC transporter ATP-binding protein [Selenomonadaceae bacterium]MBR1859374.1 ABC transporter ATP-binding protein [Selenomonadaceae bacterium]
MHLTAEHISCHINGKQILNDISYSFTEGKRIGIIGANGAGKSTLLKILCLLNKNFAGTVALNGENIKHFNRTDLAKIMAILPQEREIPSDVTIKQLTSYGRFPYRKIFGSSNPADDRDAITWALKVTQLTEFADRQVSTLSGGERQRAWLAMTLAQKPKILLLDEPTTYLDIKHQLEVMEIISDINKRYGMTIIMVLHDLNHAKMFTDELLIIKNGSIFKSGSSKTILTVDVVNRVFGVNADIFTNQKGDKFVLPVSIAK